ncbi:MAG TPA: histidine phosphatase family protein [Catenuloplanes sp.]|jgi:phosphohistidine phosphatase
MTGRILVLLRHAKADRPNDVGDFDRPLTARGHADASAAGAWLTRRALVPDLVLCSAAKRARQTWHGVAVAMAEAAAAGGGPTVRYERPLYEGGPQDLLEEVRQLADEIHTVLVVGHNPTMSQVSTLLDGRPGVGDADGLRTSGLAVHRFDGPWKGCGPGAAELTEAHTARG